MAFNTRHIDMLSVEFKGCLVVVESGRDPFFRGMAFGTVSDSVFFKLSEMLIGMTIIAFPWQTGELLLRNGGIIAF